MHPEDWMAVRPEQDYPILLSYSLPICNRPGSVALKSNF